MLIQWLRSEMLRPCYEEDPGTPTGGTPAVSLPSDAEQEPADDFDKPRALETIRKQREEAKALRAQLKDLEALKAADKQRKDAELSETERLTAALNDLTAQHAAAQAQLKRANLKEAIADAATKKGLTFAQGALSDALTLGLFDALVWEDDKPKGLAGFLGELSQSRPYLFAQPAQPPDIGATERGKQNGKSPDADKFSRWGIKMG